MALEPTLKTFPKRSWFKAVPFSTLHPLPGLSSSPRSSEKSGAQSHLSTIPGDTGNLPWKISALKQRSTFSTLLHSLFSYFFTSSILPPWCERESFGKRLEKCNPLSSWTLKWNTYLLPRRAPDRLDSCHSYSWLHKFLICKLSLRFYYVPGIMLAPVRDTKASDLISDFDSVREDDKPQTHNSKIFKGPL